jgi:hypothetical protein
MCLSKRDDQTLATMGRIASYKPKMASNFAHQVHFDNDELRESVHKFWDLKIKEDGQQDKESFCRALKTIGSVPDSMGPFDKLIVHWLEAFSEKCERTG